MIVVADDTELYPGLYFLQFMRNKLPATTDTDKKTTGISAVKFADAMAIPIASTAPWNRCKISNIFVPSANEDGYYVLSGKRWKKAALTSKHNDVSNHGSSSSKSPIKGDARDDEEKMNMTIPDELKTKEEQTISNTNDSEKEEQTKNGEKSIDKNQEVGNTTTTVMSNVVTDTPIGSIVMVDTMCTESDLYAAGAFDDNECTVFTDAQVKEAQEMYRKRAAAEAAKKVEEEKARKAAAEAAKKVEEEEARKAAPLKRKRGKKRKTKTWTMPQTLEEIPLWKKRNKKKDFIAKQLSSDGTSYTYWIKDNEKRQWEEYTNDNDFMQSYLDMW